MKREYQYAIRFAMKNYHVVQAPNASQFSITEKSNLRQAFYFGLEIDLNVFIQPKDIQID